MKEKKSNVETTTLNQVSEEEKKGWVEVAFIHAGVMICVPSLLIGGLLALAMPLGQALLAGCIGYGLVMLFACFTSIQGSDLGLPSCVVLQSCFGKAGSKYLISLLFTISLLGWFGVNNAVCGSAFSNLMANSFGIEVPVSVSILIWGVIMLTTAVYGISAMGKLNTLAVPALLIVCLAGCVMALRTHGTENINTHVETTMSLIEGITLTTGFLTMQIVTAADITRYQKGRGNTIKATLWGVLPAGILMLVIGIVMAKVAGEYDISQVLCNVGLPVLGMIVLILAAWTTNTTNAYLAGINIVNILGLKDDKRAMVTLISGLIGTILAVVGVMSQFEAFITWLGAAFSPMGGVMLVDYWILRKANPEKWSPRESFDWLGVTAWAAGFVLNIFVTSGLVLVQSILLSGIVYYALCKGLRKEEYHGAAL
ncbi:MULTISPECIES: cytosine permease [Anaerotruncus]|nr:MULTISPECIES: cytosine permease [Anaerotruncus]MCI9640866.1 cytosine permease [Emergencia sp.]